MRLGSGWMLAMAMLLAAGAATAQRVEGDRARAQGVYQAEVTVRSQNEAERKAGFARALAQVLVKLSGDRAAASRAGVRDLLADAGDYVEGYDYRQDEGVSSLTGAPSFDTVLVVRFDQDQVEAVASALGLPIWPQPRPKPVLWLAIDDGSGPRLVGYGQNDVVRSLNDRALDRGFRLGLPSGNAAEQVAAGAIWRGDVEAIARLSSRYSPPMQLVGKLYRNKGGWTADWTFVDHGRVLSSWSVDDPNPRRAMAAGADGAADALADRYARHVAAGPAGSYSVLFQGIDGSDDYIRLSGYLQSLSVVRGITPVRAGAGGLELRLELLTGTEGLRRLVEHDDGKVLVGGEGDPPVYRMR